MSITKTPKKKISVSLSGANIEKIENIIKQNPKETTSSVIDTSLEYSLEEVGELLKKPLELEEALLKRKLEDIQKIKRRNQKNN